MVSYKDLDNLGQNKTPFFFIIDFLQENILIYKEEDFLNNSNILFEFPEFKNNKNTLQKSFNNLSFKYDLINENDFKNQFDLIHNQIKQGNTYLTNLTFETPIITENSLEDIFNQVKAKYKILLKNNFVCFSPEPFIKIENGIIKTFPMKGTISANIKNAEKILLENEKEQSEHFTVVDLLRNDLSQIANNVNVEKFRYLDKIKTQEKEIFQTSSIISGKIKPEYNLKIGSILQKLLPAGSITGAPKKKTIQIILETEKHKRNFYTGISGYFDGEKLDSCVNIRYIEQRNKKLFYKSGAGIHLKSNWKQEHNEIIDKIYVPIH